MSLEMNEPPLLSWLKRIELNRLIHYLDALNITKIHDLKKLSEEQIQKIDLT